MIPLYVSDSPLSCINKSATEFNLPAKLIIAVLNVERGERGLWMKNTNGTVDVGPMQINSRWFPLLAHYGYSPQEITFNACTNIRIGSWLLARAIADNPYNFWNAVGDYHSHTPRFNYRYAAQVKQRWQQIEAITHTINSQPEEI